MQFAAFLLAPFLFAGSDLSAVHEWGTFTSVAGADGSPQGWRPLYGPSDLPCFVHRLDQKNLKLADYGTVRMETPVLYFYPLKPTVVSVRVNFPSGRITEWYPQASSVQPALSRCSWIEWNHVQVSKTGAAPPTLGAASHYYAARETSAWPLQSEGEQEKLLFYRGIGNLAVDLHAVAREDGVELRNSGNETIPAAIVYENHGGKIGFSVIHGLHDAAEVKFSALTGPLKDLRPQFETELVKMGLYQDEARAMLATWSDSWFEEGLRVFYILPRTKVDTLLPISIQPAPGQLTRVFVGRVELLSPKMRAEIGGALRRGDVSVLKKYGRFLDAFLNQIYANLDDRPMNGRARRLLIESDRRIAEEAFKTPCSH